MILRKDKWKRVKCLRLFVGANDIMLYADKTARRLSSLLSGIIVN